MRSQHRLSLAIGAAVALGCSAFLACKPEREPPQISPTSGTGVVATSGGGGGFTVGSGQPTTVTSGPAPDVEHCACIFATRHEDTCIGCVADEQEGDCAGSWAACESNADCRSLALYCIGAAASDAATIDTCLGAEGPVRDLLEAYYDCICKVGNCSIDCNESGECGATTASSASSSASSSGASTSSSSSASSSSASSSSASSSSTGP